MDQEAIASLIALAMAMLIVVLALYLRYRKHRCSIKSV